jgi:hypothetical protein
LNFRELLEPGGPAESGINLAMTPRRMEELDMNASWTRTLTRLAAAALLLLPVAAVFGQDRDEYGDVALNDVQQTVARVSNLYGNASYARGDQPDDWQPADVNVPMTNGDRVYTDRHSRLELQVHGGGAIRLGAMTDLVALNVTEDTKQFALKAGVASFQVRNLDRDDVFEVDTPNAAVNFDTEGDYRFDIDQNGNTRVSVRRGRATVTAGGGEVPLQQGDAMLIDGGDNPRYDVVSMNAPDGWDRWTDERAGRYANAASYRYVSHDISGADDLDEYGRWQQVPNYGWAWSPTTVEVGWTPYRVGHWAWQDPWGWTWISTEPWGWAPYHYGRWVTYSSRWYWLPGTTVARVAYAPACVAFVGGSPGVSVAVSAGPASFVGWFPLGPSEPIIPWWRPQAVTQVNVTNVTYVNKTYVTVVNQNTFVSAQPVARSIVTDRTVVQQVAAAPVVRSVPVLPTIQSTRVSVRQAPAPAPPAAIAQRSVVARVAPPPAPPRFDQKLAVIRESRAPIAPTQAARLAVQQNRATAPVQVRPAAAERVTLQPRTAVAGSPGAAPRPMPTPRPVTATAATAATAAAAVGRQLATREQPVATAPVAGPRASARAGAAAREAQAPPAREPASQPVPAQSRPGQPEVDTRGQVARPTVARPGIDTRDAQPGRPDVQTRESQSPTDRARPVAPPVRSEAAPPVRSEAAPPVRSEAAPPVRPEVQTQDERRVATPDWRSRANERSAQQPESAPPSRRIVTPPDRDNGPANRPVPPRAAEPPAREERPAPTARPDVSERSQPRNDGNGRERVQPPPQVREDRQSAERVAPQDRGSRDNPNAHGQQQGRRPTPTRARPTPRDNDKPDR